PPPLPLALRDRLERLRLSEGLAYRGLVFHFVQDPDGGDRLPRLKKAAPPRVRELRPVDPELVAVRPPRGRSSELLLAGELLDAPHGTRVVLADAPFGSSGRKVRVRPVVGLSEVPARSAPVLRAPVLLPSSARFALLAGDPARATVGFLETLDRGTVGGVHRLRLELDRFEGEARTLEQRLRARLRNTRGLRGLALSLGERPRSIDLFRSARAFAAALPKLLRAALLERVLAVAYGPDDPAVDWASTAIRPRANETLRAHAKLLARLATARAVEAAAPLPHGVDARYELPPAQDCAGRLSLCEGRLVHAALVVAPPR
ncbi:MAG: hypothetical protein D6731_14925, partial [Planctomycetota bacterium]